MRIGWGKYLLKDDPGDPASLGGWSSFTVRIVFGACYVCLLLFPRARNPCSIS